MKITLVTGSYPDMPCGVGDHVAHLGAALARRGHQVRVVTSRDSRVHPVPEVLPAIDSWGPGCDRKVADAAGDSEILHFHAPSQGYGRSLAARRIPASKALRMPVVSTVHEYSNLHWLHRWAMRPILRGSRALIVPGEDQARSLRERWPKVTHIPVGPNILPDRAAGARSANQICFFGMAYPGKGLGALLEAMRLLNGIKLTMIGQIHPGYRSLYETLQRQGDDRVTWTGRLEPAEISKILSTSALCVLPFEEGASLRRTSLVSALAHGTPVVTTRPRSPIDGLGDAAFLVDRAEPKLLADAIRMLLEDDSRRGRLSESAARFASSLSWEVIAQRTEEVYRQCLATTSG